MLGPKQERAIPERQLAWTLYGKGLENMGKAGKPVEWPVPKPAANQLLARVDAAGLCFSDVKIIRLGNEHPRILGRDLQTEPSILGHEASLTIVEVGKELRGQFQVGDRFVVQADIYYQGKNLAFGYLLPGALEQYVLLGDEILRGDDGVYLVPVKQGTGYSEAALAEPWACVLCAYRQHPRTSIAPGGVVWVIGRPGCEQKGYHAGAFAYTSAVPRRILCTDVPETYLAALKGLALFAAIKVEQTAPLAELDVAALAGERGIDDIFILNADAEAIEKAAPALAKWGILNIVTDQPLARKASIDLGSIHYAYHAYVGCKGPDVSLGYVQKRKPALVDGGKCWMLGGAGPMGQMHVQLAIERAGGPRLVVVSDIDNERLDTIPTRFAAAAKRYGKQLVCLNPKELGEEAFDAKLRELAPQGFDDIVVFVPAASVVEQASEYLADSGMINLFAGIPRGTNAELDMGAIALRGIRYTGTSGSSIDDLRTAIAMTERGELSPNRSVAAIGGLAAARDGMQTVMEGTFPGKVVIYPQIVDLELTALPDLADKLPEVAAYLDPDGAWTKEAEAALLRKFAAR